MQLTIVLVHNKGDQANQAQIEAFKPLINLITDSNTDENGNTFDTYHYELQGLDGWQVKFFQIIPFGVTPPSNLYDIDSFKTFYGAGDEDKTGDHPRFFNHGMRFPYDSMGADCMYIIDDYTQFSVDNLNSLLTPTATPTMGKMTQLATKDQIQQADLEVQPIALQQDGAGKLQSGLAFMQNGEIPEDQPVQDSLDKIIGGQNE